MLASARLRRPLLVALAIYWCSMFIGTHIPNPEALIPKDVSDKSLHFWAYGGLAVLLAGYTMTAGPLSLRAFGKLWLIIAAYGVADELLQIPVGRHADTYDWLADMLGTTTALIFMGCLQYFQSGRSSLPTK